MSSAIETTLDISERLTTYRRRYAHVLEKAQNEIAQGGIEGLQRETLLEWWEAELDLFRASTDWLRAAIDELDARNRQ